MVDQVPDRDGPLGAGASFTTIQLTEGSHTVTAAVMDTAGLLGQAQIMIVVRPPNAVARGAGAETEPPAPCDPPSDVSGDTVCIAGEVVDVNSAQLVGVMWGDSDQFALVEDGEGFGYILRVGDRVLNGRVVSIRKDRLTARLTLYGISNTVVLKLEKPEAK